MPVKTEDCPFRDGGEWILSIYISIYPGALSIYISRNWRGPCPWRRQRTDPQYLSIYLSIYQSIFLSRSWRGPCPWRRKTAPAWTGESGPFRALSFHTARLVKHPPPPHLHSDVITPSFLLKTLYPQALVPRPTVPS